jgi:uncharacterized membrane protein
MVVWLSASIVMIFFPIQNTTLLRVVLTIPVVLFIPGYCLIAALFPKEGDIELLERIALSFGLSLAVVPLIGLGLNFTPWGIRLDSLVISLTIFNWVMVLIAHYRRARLPSGERYRIPFSEIAGTIRKGIIPIRGSRIDQLLSFILVLFVLIAIITTFYMIASPKEGERFTEFYILGEKQMAADYPDHIIVGQNYPLFIGVGNHEYVNTSYTIELWTLQREFDTVTNTSSIVEMDLSDRQSFTLAHNETKIIPSILSVNKTGYNQVVFLLFNESVPDPDVNGSDRINASYLNLRLMVDVR